MISKNLKYYRLKQGLTMRELAQSVGITSMSISHYESGTRTPDVATLRKLAETLNVRLADLLKLREAHIYNHGEFRKNSRFRVSSQAYVYEAIEEYFGRFLNVVELLGGPVLAVPPVCHTLKPTFDAEADARALRVHLGLSESDPVRGLVGVLEDKGLLIYQPYIDSNHFSGINGTVDGRPYIVINGNMTSERQRSTLAHELAHMFFDFDGIPASDAEKHVTAISGAFLFPAGDALRELGPRRTRVASDMLMVAAEYGISMSLLVVRAHQLNILGEGAYREYMIMASKAGWRTNEPSRIPQERSDLFEQLVLRAVGEEEITVSKGAELLQVPHSEMLQKLHFS